MEKTKAPTFTRYQVFIIAILAILSFTVILDFMVLSPLGAILLDQLHIKTSQFGLVVSVYAFSAGISGLFAAGFADKFDRKKMLLFFYGGFMLGTLLCALAPNYEFLLVARVVTGLFGGVISSISMAIISDLFTMEVRGRVMGFTQMGFAASQVLGIPIGLWLANRSGWHSPFWMITGFGTVVGLIIARYMKPIDKHLHGQAEKNPLQHFAKVISNRNYIRAFLATILLATGGFMMMPFGTAFGIHNLGLTMEQLPTLYLITGICSIAIGPLAGKASDKVGKYPMFIIGTVISILMVLIYTNLGVTPFWQVTLLNVILFVGILSRMISASALMTAIPEMHDRGAFMSVNASIQQFSGGIAAAVAGLIVVQSDSGKLLHYNTLGLVVTGAMILTMIMLYFLNKFIMRQKRVSIGQADQLVQPEAAPALE
jgi:predicted MFS family arabinose efflux permease